MVLKLHWVSECPKGLVKIRIAGSLPRVLGSGPRICISDKFPDNADAVGPGTTLRTTGLNNSGPHRFLASMKLISPQVSVSFITSVLDKKRTLMDQYLHVVVITQSTFFIICLCVLICFLKY